MTAYRWIWRGVLVVVSASIVTFLFVCPYHVQNLGFTGTFICIAVAMCCGAFYVESVRCQIIEDRQTKDVLGGPLPWS